MPHRGLSLFLALALLLFSWAELDHVGDLEGHKGGDACAYCLYTGALDNGASPVAPVLPPQSVLHLSVPQRQETLVFPRPARHTLGQRGPPTLS